MSDSLHRRSFLNRLGAALAATVALPAVSAAKRIKQGYQSAMLSEQVILNVSPMGFQWDTLDPFLFCVHHEDDFPKGNEQMGPTAELLKGRHMGDDFIIKDGFRMYHGKVVPGFPGHPHRGFETVTIVRKGIVDHADSMGAAGRYGNGDVQWMTAGKGVQHSEMFPLIHKDKDNPLELFQIWLNLPKRNKMVEPHFKMFWGEKIPKYIHKDANNHKTIVEVIAGKLDHHTAPAPPPDSWAADANHHVAIWNIKMDANAVWKLPKTAAGVNRMLYYYEGESLTLNGQKVTSYHSVQLKPDVDVVIGNGNASTSILILQGMPIGEQVMQYGPFVMNTKDEIKQAFEDYHATQFGGWPWQRYDQVHPRDKGRFARHADGKVEEPKKV